MWEWLLKTLQVLNLGIIKFKCEMDHIELLDHSHNCVFSMFSSSETSKKPQLLSKHFTRVGEGRKSSSLTYFPMWSVSFRISLHNLLVVLFEGTFSDPILLPSRWTIHPHQTLCIVEQFSQDFSHTEIYPTKRSIDGSFIKFSSSIIYYFELCTDD